MTFAVNRAALGVSILLVLGGCTSGANSPASPSASVAPAPPSASPSSPAQSPRTLTFELNPIGAYTANGTVVIDITGDGYTMTVTVLGLDPDSHHLLNMHGGTCSAPDLELILPLSHDVQADGSGMGTFMTTYPSDYLIPAAGRIVAIHGNSPDQADRHIACATLTN